MEKLVIEIVFSDHESYFYITDEIIQEVLAEPDLKKRDKLIVERIVRDPVDISSSYDVDLFLVIDSWVDAKSRWSDFEESLKD